MPDRLPPDLDELFRAAKNYSAKRSKILATLVSQVQHWFAANECMVQFYPLTQEAITIGSDRWYTTKAAWYSRDESGRCYEHGFDENGHIRIVRYGEQILKAFVYEPSFTDELILAGGSFRGLTRHLFENGKLMKSNFLSWPGLSVTWNEFFYDGDYLIEHRSRYGDIDKASNSLSTHDVENVHRLAWDTAVPQKHLIDVRLNTGELLYVGYQHRKLTHHPVKPLIAFSLDVDDMGDESDVDGLAGQCYSLEMTADFDWQFDRVLLCMPEALSKVTQGSEVCSTGLEAGGRNVQSVDEIKLVAEHGGKWVWIDMSHPARHDLLEQAAQNQMKVVINISETDLTDLNWLISEIPNTPVEAIVCNWQSATATELAAVVRSIRQALHDTSSSIRVLTSFAPDSEADLIDYFKEVGADGVYIDRVPLPTVITLLNQVGLHSYTSIPTSVDNHYVLSGR